MVLFLRTMVALFLVTTLMVSTPAAELVEAVDANAKQESEAVQEDNVEEKVEEKQEEPKAEVQEEKVQAEKAEEKPAPFYTYEQLWLDIELLSDQYNEYVQYGTAGTTVCGRDIPYVILGNPLAEKKIFVTSSIHAREYINVEIVMKMIEEYAKAYSNGERQEVLQKTCFYIMPNCNPDGVALVQYGIEAVKGNSEAYEIIKSQNRKNFSSWKANANGVDLNRNWDAGWEIQKDQSPGPSDHNFKGYSPHSEKEIEAILFVMTLAKWDAVINFHQQGNVIYCGSGLGTAEYNNSCIELAKVCRRLNGYTIYPPSKSNAGDESYGTFGDYLALVNIPFFTIETGNKLRSQAQIPTIYKKNVNVFSAISEVL